MVVIGPDTPGKVGAWGPRNLILPILNAQHADGRAGTNQRKQWSSLTLGFLICPQTPHSRSCEN